AGWPGRGGGRRSRPRPGPCDVPRRPAGPACRRSAAPRHPDGRGTRRRWPSRPSWQMSIWAGCVRVGRDRLLAAPAGQPLHRVADQAAEVRGLTDPGRAAAVADSTLLPGDAAGAVAALKQEPGPDLLVLGSGELLGSLTTD